MKNRKPVAKTEPAPSTETESKPAETPAQVEEKTEAPKKKFIGLKGLKKVKGKGSFSSSKIYDFVWFVSSYCFDVFVFGFSFKEKEEPAKEQVQSKPSSGGFKASYQSKYKHLLGKLMHKDNNIENITKLAENLPSESDAFAGNKDFLVYPISGVGGRLAVVQVIFISDHIIGSNSFNLIYL